MHFYVSFILLFLFIGMNPFARLKIWITAEMLAKTDDVFEKARIHLTYNFTLFFLLLGLLFYVNIFANHLWWQFYITTFGIVLSPFNFLMIKKADSIQPAAYLFVVQQVVLSLGNMWLYHFELNIIGGFWSLIFIVFVFFVLGKGWGFAISAFVMLELLIGSLDKLVDGALLDYDIPPDQVPLQLPVFVIVPFLICIYTIYQIVDTRKAAEQKINEQRLQLQRNNEELAHQKQDIVSSINYAQKIQRAILPNDEAIERAIPLSFIYYKPKDIVSGDFYWFHEIDKDKCILVCADCTGHGVPGAFMTVIASNLLNQTVIDNKIYDPSDILMEVDRLLNMTLKQDKERQGVQDGMDLSMVHINKQARQITITSAKRPVVFISNKHMQEFKGSKFSIGGMREGDKTFEGITLDYKEEDMLYFFTDGYHDQFGGEKGKKYSSKRLKEFLFTIHSQSIPEQKQMLDTEIKGWMKNLEQVDDMCVVGIRF